MEMTRLEAVQRLFASIDRCKISMLECIDDKNFDGAKFYLGLIENANNIIDELYRLEKNRLTLDSVV